MVDRKVQKAVHENDTALQWSQSGYLEAYELSTLEDMVSFLYFVNIPSLVE